jgi:AcrR family transcriptional regulator
MVFHNSREGRLSSVSPAVAKVDARIERTRRRLREALVELVLENGYESATIRDLADRAGVGYATYFRHYPTKDALLLDLLEDLLADLMALLEPTLADEDASRNGAMVFEHVRDHADLYRVLIASERHVDLVPRAFEVARSGLGRSIEPAPGALLPPDAALNHLVRSFVALIEWWLGAGMPVPPERMGLAFEALIMSPVRAVAFRRAAPAP